MLLVCHEIIYSIVFRSLPAKAQTEAKRRKDRDAAKAKAKEFLRAGKTEEAKKEFAKGVDITHEHAVQLMTECRKLGVDCITAMYEADSQLAYLNKIGIADYIISEDSDLILFGCNKILFKLQLDGRCLLFESEKLHMTISASQEKFSFEKFRRICILSGCDYLNSLHGIGLSKARKFMMLTEESDMKRALLKIPSYLNMKNLTVTDEYIDGFLKAEATFKFMFVYDPVKRSMVRLNDLDENDAESEHCTNAGALLDPEYAFQLALGNINPRTLQRLDNFDPDIAPPSGKNGKLDAKFPSIWRTASSSFKPSGNFKQQSRINNFFNLSARKHQQPAAVQNIIEQENNVTAEVEMNDLVSSYCITEISQPKRRNCELDDVPQPLTPSRNPFAKRHQPEVEKKSESPSLLKTIALKDEAKAVNKFKKIVVNQKSGTVSRFFTDKSATSESSQDEASDNEINKLNEIRREKNLRHQQFYEAIKADDDASQEIKISPSQPISTPDDESPDSGENEVVDLDKYEFTVKSPKQSFIKPRAMPQLSKWKSRGPSVSKVRTTASQKFDDSSTQTKLSKFGFQKRSTFN